MRQERGWSGDAPPPFPLPLLSPSFQQLPHLPVPSPKAPADMPTALRARPHWWGAHLLRSQGCCPLNPCTGIEGRPAARPAAGHVKAAATAPTGGSIFNKNHVSVHLCQQAEIKPQCTQGSIWAPGKNRALSVIPAPPAVLLGSRGAPPRATFNPVHLQKKPNHTCHVPLLHHRMFKF